MITHRIFLSTVTNEFKSCRVRMGDDLRSPSVLPLHQERDVENQASGHSTLIKLDDLIKDCHSVIHLIGQQTSSDGRVAAAENVDDLLVRYPELSITVGLTEAELRTLSYTQWEAWLAYYHIKKTNPNLKLVIATPASDFQPDNPPHTATARDQELSQAWHEKQLKKRCRYVEVKAFANATELSNAILKALKDILPGQQPEQKIALSRLVSRHTGPESIGEFLGREDELKLLNEAWATPGTNVLSIIAWGGVGKTALLAEWIDRRFVQCAWNDDTGQPDPLFYFDWTFYDQGTRSDDATHAGAASVDSFFDTALRFFGDPEPHLPGKGARLAALIQKHRALLVLDGLEPMQYPPNHLQAGQITDPDLHALLATLAQRNPGLCVLTSRQVLTGLRRVDRHNLDELPEPVAIRLLQKLGVIGTDEDLAAAVRDYFGHALSLIVLGRFLYVKGGDIRLRDTIKLERANERRPETTTRNAWHVLEAYEEWLASPDGRTEDLQALRLTGLFDRPASPDCLDALRRAPAIPGLTDQLVPLDDDAWNAVLHRLHEAHFIQLRFPPREANSLAPLPEARQVSLDAHPLIREYFAGQLRDKQQPSCLTAHSRIFDHLCEATEYRPETLDGLQPLYQAVAHGCLAGRQQEALFNVFECRIRRWPDPVIYSTRIVGALGADLEAISSFFEFPWIRMGPNLTRNDKGWLLHEVAICLTGLGRLTEAERPMQQSVEIAVLETNWKSVSVRYLNLSRLQASLGSLRNAVVTACRAVVAADKIGNDFRAMDSRANVAYILFQCGEREESLRIFELAECIQREREPGVDLLYSMSGMKFCELILARAEREAWVNCIVSSPFEPVGCLLDKNPGNIAPETVPLIARIDYTTNGDATEDEEWAKNERSEWLEAYAEWQNCHPIMPGCHPRPSASQTDPCSECNSVAPLLPIASTTRQETSFALLDAEFRAQTALQACRSNTSTILDTSTNHLTIASLTLYRSLLNNAKDKSASFDQSNTCLALAIEGLRKANEAQYLPRALLTAALHHHAIMGDAETARGFLDEAQQIAERGPMPLYLADVHLHRARLFRDKAELQKARAQIEKHGYWRRKEELEDAEAASVNWKASSS